MGNIERHVGYVLAEKRKDNTVAIVVPIVVVLIALIVAGIIAFWCLRRRHYFHVKKDGSMQKINSRYVAGNGVACRL